MVLEISTLLFEHAAIVYLCYLLKIANLNVIKNNKKLQDLWCVKPIINISYIAGYRAIRSDNHAVIWQGEHLVILLHICIVTFCYKDREFEN